MDKREYTLKEFKEVYENDISVVTKYHNYDFIYNTYYDKIEPYQHLITKYQNSDAITIDEILVVFGVSKSTFNLCRHFFYSLDNLVKHKRNIMKMVNEMHLQEGIKLSPSNPKLIEMEARLYNDEWKDKSADVEVNMPTELTITFDDESVRRND